MNIGGCDVTAVISNDCVANTKAEPSALPESLGGVKRIEDPTFVLETRPTIRHLQANLLSFRPRLYQYCLGLCQLYRIDPIGKNIHKTLVHMRSIPKNLPQS